MDKKEENVLPSDNAEIFHRWLRKRLEYFQQQRLEKNTPLKELDEEGFVFLDVLDRPFLCRMWGDQPWLFYWHPDNHWVSLRPLSQMEVWSLPHNLTDEQMQIYRNMNNLHGKIK